MSKAFPVIFFVALSFILIILQSTFFSPRQLGAFSPDLNLILVIFLALFSEIKGKAIMVIGNGYMMDILSGYMLGIHTLSRLSVFALMQGFSANVNSQSKAVQATAIFFGTLFSWSFVWVVFKIKGNFQDGISFGGVIAQCVINTVIGIPLFLAIKRLHARI